MFRRVIFISLAIFLPLLAAGLLTHISQSSSQTQQPEQKIDEALRTRLEEQPGNRVRFLVHLSTKANLQQDLPQARDAKRAAIVDRLRQTAESSQRDLVAVLARLEAQGDVTQYRALWIVNAIAVEARSHVPYVLAQRSDVAHVVLDMRQQYIAPPELQPQEAPPTQWNIDHVRARHVWNGLGVTGLGVTIGIMDTGVDWRHPDLRTNYRGVQSDGTIQHSGHWFDVLGVTPSAEPFDPNGHGTHVAGTAVGRAGIGVAPDAKWIAVRAFDSNGFATTSDLHLAFQWILAPAGQSQLAPDIVSGSWSGSGRDASFSDDIHALHQAGIVTVFAAGNTGPLTGTIGAPASYSGAIGVAAVDYRDEVTWFSARGPSPLTSNPKPELAAPGARIYSTLPGATYGIYNGTSMATPHVSGAAALLLSANPTLSIQEVTRVLTETARNNADGVTDIHQGWGQLDVYAATASQLPVGRIEGQVTDGSAPVAGATVSVTTSTNAVLTFETDAHGQYRAWLRPGAYILQAHKYGYASATPRAVNVVAGGAAHHELVLERLPHSTISGRIFATPSGDPLPANVVALHTPISVTANPQGAYTLTLPAGHDYMLRAQHNGFTLETITVTLEANTPFRKDFDLVPTQSVLLVDSGRWYYDSHASYYRQALADAGFAHDEWHVYAPGVTPPLETLTEYDAVVWSAPQDGPAWSGGGDALAAYLETGGNLFISGQDAARLDGVGQTAHTWFTEYLEGRYLTNASEPFTLTGVSGTPYAGANLTLNTPDSAANQVVPARVAPRDGSLTRPILTYPGDSNEAGGALQAGWCQPHRIIFLGFGLEGAGPAQVRMDLLRRALDHFEAPPVSRALNLDPQQINEVVLPGETLTVTFNLQNLSEVQTTTIQLDYSSQWAAHLSHDNLQLGPCQQQPVTLTLQVPAQLAPGARQDIELTAQADYGAIAGASVVASAPAPVLLVADYRWYDETSAYRKALQEQEVAYDVWDSNERGSPPYERLAAYETILWYTGYDWYQPLTPDEIDTLERYLLDGGRLFLTSQDYLYYHRQDDFTRRYLGVQDYQETLTSTVMLGDDNALAGDGIGPLTLSYDVYRNFGDSLAPAPTSDVYLWNEWGYASGTATRGASWRTVFWGVPFELLPEGSRTLLLGNILGWLGDVGDSTLEVTPRVGPSSATRHYTLTVRNWQYGNARDVAMTTTFTSSLVIDPSSISGGAAYDANHQRLTWQGEMAPGDAHIITFRAQGAASTATGTRLDVTTTLGYSGQNNTWRHTAPTWLAGPELSTSSLSVDPTEAKPDQAITYAAYIRNTGTVPAEEISSTLTLPRGLRIVTETVRASEGTVTIRNKHIIWQGSVAANAMVSLTVSAEPTSVSDIRALPAGLVIVDGVSTPIVRNSTLYLSPYRRLFPLIQR